MPAPLPEALGIEARTVAVEASTAIEARGGTAHPCRDAMRDLPPNLIGGDWTMVLNAMILTHAVLRAERNGA